MYNELIRLYFGDNCFLAVDAFLESYEWALLPSIMNRGMSVHCLWIQLSEALNPRLSSLQLHVTK